MRIRRLTAAGWLLFAPWTALAAGDWRPTLARLFSSIDASKAGSAAAPTIEALKPLWEQAPTLGAEWALLQSQPITLELETHGNLSAEKFDSLPREEQRALLFRAAEKVTLESRRHADHLLAEIESGLPAIEVRDDAAAQRLVSWKSGLLVLERWRLYIEPEQGKRLDGISKRVNAGLWNTPRETMKRIVGDLRSEMDTIPGADPNEFYTKLALESLLRERAGWPNPDESLFASQLRPYSPALDPNRFYLLPSNHRLTRAVLGFSDWTMARRHGISLGPGLPMESYLFVKEHEPWEPTSSPHHAHVAIHEGFHAVERPGTFEKLMAAFKPIIGDDAASALSHILIEGLTELRARRAFASLLADGDAGKTPFLREIHENLKKEAPPASGGDSLEAWIDHWLGPAHRDHTYSPYVSILKTLETSLGGIWAIEDLIYRTSLAGVEKVLRENESALRKMGQQLVHFIRYGTLDAAGMVGDDFQVRRVLLDVLDAMFAGQRYSPESIDRLLVLNQDYHGSAYAARAALRKEKQDAFKTAVKAPRYGPDVKLSDVHFFVEQAARRQSWIPGWVPNWFWRLAFRLFSRLGLPLL